MEILSIVDAVTTLSTTSQGGGLLGFDKSFPTVVTRILSISSVDTIQRPRIRHNRSRSIPRSFTRKKRRTRKRSQTYGDGGDDSDNGEGNGFFGDGNEGPFGGGGSFGNGGGGGFGNGGGGGGGGGRGWNFDGNEGPSPDPAFDFVLQVLSWIILSDCLHFSFKRVVRIIADGGGIEDPSRDKVV